jgi:anti-sigma regulatory factor (Ser/Thr protein kinase)
VTPSAGFELVPTARSVPEARRLVVDTLRAWQLGDLADVAALLTSELVTNAVLHARTTITLAVEREGSSVRIAVTDSSPVGPAMRHHSETATTGRGLRLVDNLALAWDVDGDADGKTVWFRLAIDLDAASSLASDQLEGAGA